MIIYHNPRCAKSRAGLQYLEEKGYEIEVRKYLSDGITVDQLKEIIEKTGEDAFHFVRTNEPEYISKYKGKKLTNDQWIKILAENPKLLQRPIVINGNKAVLANPPENIEDIM